MVSDCGAPDIILLILPATMGFTATASGWPVAQVSSFVKSSLCQAATLYMVAHQLRSRHSLVTGGGSIL